VSYGAPGKVMGKAESENWLKRHERHLPKMSDGGRERPVADTEPYRIPQLDEEENVIRRLEGDYDAREISEGVNIAQERERCLDLFGFEDPQVAFREYQDAVFASARLTSAQRRVLSAIFQGKSQADIASKLKISPQAVSKTIDAGTRRLVTARVRLGGGMTLIGFRSCTGPKPKD